MKNTKYAVEVAFGTQNDSCDDRSIPPSKKRKKPSGTSTWSNNDVNALIQEVEKYPCVWKYASVEYKNRFKRDQAWRKISEKCFGHDVEECKAKWANIKTAFVSVKKKMSRKSSQGVEISQPHYPYWTAMQFFDSHANSDIKISPNLAKTIELAENDKSRDSELVQRSAKNLETYEKDNWHVIGMYLASQLRHIANINKTAANKLHLQLVKTTLDAVLETDGIN